MCMRLDTTQEQCYLQDSYTSSPIASPLSSQDDTKLKERQVLGVSWCTSGGSSGVMLNESTGWTRTVTRRSLTLRRMVGWYLNRLVLSYSGELRHGTCHFCTRYTGISKINSGYRNPKDQIKLELYIDEALSYTLVPWKPYLWA